MGLVSRKEGVQRYYYIYIIRQLGIPWLSCQPVDDRVAFLISPVTAIPCRPSCWVASTEQPRVLFARRGYADPSWL